MSKEMKGSMVVVICLVFFMCTVTLGGTVLIAKKASKNSENSFFIIFYCQKEIEINESGAIKITSKTKSLLFDDLGLTEDESITNVFFSGFSNNEVILIVEKANDESGNVLVCRMDLRSPKIKWKTELPVINPAPGLIERHFLYEAGAGSAAKINLRTGNLEWENRELKDKATGQLLEVFKIGAKDKLIVAFFSGLKGKSENNCGQIFIRKKDGAVVNGHYPLTSKTVQE